MSTDKIKAIVENIDSMTSAEIRRIASELGVKNYTKYKKLELIEVIEKIVEALEEEEKGKSTKNLPREGSKSLEIYDFLISNPEMSRYKIAKKFETYYSVVDRVYKTYIKNK